MASVVFSFQLWGPQQARNPIQTLCHIVASHKCYGVNEWINDCMVGELYILGDSFIFSHWNFKSTWSIGGRGCQVLWTAQLSFLILWMYFISPISGPDGHWPCLSPKFPLPPFIISITAAATVDTSTVTTILVYMNPCFMSCIYAKGIIPKHKSGGRNIW